MSGDANAPSAPIVRMRGITKQFPGVLANDAVDFDLREREVHALVGENGAGKSTLMKILFGLYTSDSGTIEVDSREVQIATPQNALDLGIGMVHQHFMLIPSLTVAENIVLGAEPRRGPFLDLSRSIQRTRELSDRYGLRVRPEATVQSISVGQRQRVEILKTLSRGVKVLILDEPTAVLTPQETDDLFRVLRGLVSQGMSVVLITHKLREVLAASDRVTVMRAGRHIGTVDTAATDTEELARMMVGREVLFRVEKKPAQPRETLLEVRDLQALDNRGLPAVRGVSFSLRRGEIYGIAGVEGNGQSELIEALTGLRRPTGGRLLLGGKPVEGSSPRRLRELGVAHVPEDRLIYGTSSTSSVADNAIMGFHYRKPLAEKIWLLKGRVISWARKLIQGFDVRGARPDTLIGSLSGGNMQKVVLAREMSRQPNVLIAAQPTRGVDVGAIEFIHSKLIEYRDAGAAVLLISAELSEVMSLSDRIGVIFNGRIVAEFDAGTVTEHQLGLYMLGVGKVSA